jgi:hypothetical protein
MSLGLILLSSIGAIYAIGALVLVIGRLMAPVAHESQKGFELGLEPGVKTVNFASVARESADDQDIVASFPKAA